MVQMSQSHGTEQNMECNSSYYYMKITVPALFKYIYSHIYTYTAIYKQFMKKEVPHKLVHEY